jgi:hypothetical protein
VPKGEAVRISQDAKVAERKRHWCGPSL